MLGVELVIRERVFISNAVQINVNAIAIFQKPTSINKTEMRGCFIRRNDLQRSNWILNTRKKTQIHIPVKNYEGSLTHKPTEITDPHAQNQTKRIFHSVLYLPRSKANFNEFFMFGSKISIWTPQKSVICTHKLSTICDCRYPTMIFVPICRHLFTSNDGYPFGIWWFIDRSKTKNTYWKMELHCTGKLHFYCTCGRLAVVQFRLFCMIFVCLKRINNIFPLVSLELRHGVVKSMHTERM